MALRGRQRELKLAALEAKRRGDLEAAARSYRLAKVRCQRPGSSPRLLVTQIRPFLRQNAGVCPNPAISWFSSCFFRVWTR